MKKIVLDDGKLGIKIVFTDEEMEIAEDVGKLMRKFSVYYKKSENLTVRKDDWENIHILGAKSEFATAMFLGIEYSPKFNVGKSVPDVGCVQVRSTEHKTGHLVCTAEDMPNQPFVLAIIKNKTCFLVGWLWGMEVQNKKFWNKEYNSYWAPQKDLRPMEDLIDMNKILMENERGINDK